MKAVVCLPTYNERENLERMRARRSPTKGVSVLVIDDNSPDGTGELADRLAAEHDHVEVLHRPRKEGLGPAYLAGFRRALAEGAELVLEMDADFSHDPADVPRLIAAAADADLVLGSRYVEGGGVGNWGRVRRFVSSGGSWYARVLLGVPVRDLTGGFRCYRRAVLETLDLDAIASQGYVVPDREHLPHAPRRLPRRRGADHLRRPRARRLEDEPHDRARGDLEGAGAPPPGADRTPVESKRARAHRRDLRAGGPAGRRLRSWSTSGRPGAGPAARSSRSSPSSSPSTRAAIKFAKLDIDENLQTASRYEVLSIPTAILFQGGEAAETVIGARPRSHYEQAWAEWLT